MFTGFRSYGRLLFVFSRCKTHKKFKEGKNNVYFSWSVGSSLGCTFECSLPYVQRCQNDSCDLATATDHDASPCEIDFKTLLLLIKTFTADSIIIKASNPLLQLLEYDFR
jgi:hypothetical protein